MPRISAAEKAARMWRTAAKPPKPPADFARPARDLWRTLASSRDPSFWTRPAQLLLRRLVLTAISAEATQRAYDAEMPWSCGLGCAPRHQARRRHWR